MFVDQGVWIRPFGRLVYLMPPYVIDDEDLDTLTRAVVTVVSLLEEDAGQLVGTGSVA
jgi:adenosylmethionine-8-amino-7-oxononanoate aminotransferase